MSNVNPEKNKKNGGKKTSKFFFIGRLKFTRKSPTSTKASFHQASECARTKNVTPKIAKKDILVVNVGLSVELSNFQLAFVFVSTWPQMTQMTSHQVSRLALGGAPEHRSVLFILRPRPA